MTRLRLGGGSDERLLLGGGFFARTGAVPDFGGPGPDELEALGVSGRGLLGAPGRNMARSEAAEADEWGATQSFRVSATRSALGWRGACERGHAAATSGDGLGDVEHAAATGGDGLGDVALERS